jgi:hypothetical protein
MARCVSRREVRAGCGGARSGVGGSTEGECGCDREGDGEEGKSAQSTTSPCAGGCGDGSEGTPGSAHAS